MDEQELKESIAFLLSKAPKPVREFILSELDGFAIRMITEYALHLDQGGVLEQELLLMLLGQESPSEFSQNLQQSGIPVEDVRSILSDVNEQVFKKLQKLELLGTLPQKMPLAPERPKVAAPHITIAQPQEKIVSVPQVAQELADTPVYNLIRPDAIAPAQQAVVRTMQGDMEMLKHPGTQMQAQVATAYPSHMTPARTFQTSSVPFSQAPEPLPITRQQAPAIHPSQPVPSTPAAAPLKNQNSAQVYGGDPYREPIA